MGRRVRVVAGKKGVTLPNGHTYDGQIDVDLTDAQYAKLSATAFSSGTLQDLGAITDQPAGEVGFTPTGGIAATTAQAAIAELDTEKANKASLTPIIVKKTDNNIPVTPSGAWADIDTSGTAAARTYDVVIPNVVAGQWIEIVLDVFVQSGTSAWFMDYWTIVSGTPVNKFEGDASAANTGPASMAVIASENMIVSACVSYQVQAADIQNGSVRCRLRQRGTAGAARAFWASSGWIWRQEGRGPFG